MKSKEVHTRHHIIHSMFIFTHFPSKWQLVDDAAKWHAEFEIIFVHFSHNSTHQTCVFPNIIIAVQGNSSSLIISHTHVQKSFPVFMPCKLSRLASSSTTSKDSVFAGVTINNRVLLGVSLLSTSGKQNHFFFLFLSNVSQ